MTIIEAGTAYVGVPHALFTKNDEAIGLDIILEKIGGSDHSRHGVRKSNFTEIDCESG